MDRKDDDNEDLTLEEDVEVGGPTSGPSVDDMPIEVYVANGTIQAVTLNGERVRAVVLNFDVEFPCPAMNLEQSEDGTYYQRFIV